MTRIKHVFVLMLENRSFDHLLAFSGIAGLPAPPALLQKGAPDTLDQDPPHEFREVRDQIANGAMSGFSGDELRAFDGSALPTLVALARNSLLFDTWFSSMPGPTWPNRLFAHAGSSAGLANSLGDLASGGAVVLPSRYIRMDHMHVFEQLTSQGKTWRIYRGDFFPQVLCLRGMVEIRAEKTRPIDDLAGDIARNDVADYTFVEPDYDTTNHFARGNSQHPIGSVAAGEGLIAYVHNTIFGSKVGKDSALLITWDEHGGFYDHVPPARTTPPGDAPLSRDRASDPVDYAFDAFGVRVPAMLVSPWYPVGLASSIFGCACFDHASIVSSLRETFSLGAPLTKRDAAAPTWLSAESSRARTVAPLPTRSRATPKVRTSTPHIADMQIAGPASGTVMGFAQIAVDIDWDIARRTSVAPLATTQFAVALGASAEYLDRHIRGETLAQTPELTARAHRTMLEYLASVQAREVRYQRSAGRVRSRSRRR